MITVTAVEALDIYVRTRKDC